MKDTTKKAITYVVLEIYPCYIGGLEIFYHKLLPAISERFDVILVTNCRKAKNDRYQIEKTSRKLFSIPGTTRFATLFFTALKLISLRRKIEIVHIPYTSNGGRWGFVFPFLKRFFGIKYMLQIHGGGMGKWKRFNADRSLFKHADKITSVSEITKAEYEKRSGRDIEVVFPLVPFEKPELSKTELRAQLNIDPEEFVILFVGSLKDLKAPNILLDAFLAFGLDTIAAKKLKLIFVGDGHLKPVMEKQVEQANAQAHVQFTGKVPNEEVPGYYNSADLYVITSQYEGTPKSLLEAMFNELPIIGSRANGIENVLTHKHNGLLFDIDDSAGLHEMINEALADGELRKSMGAEARVKYDADYSFGQTIDGLTRIYNSI